ncbi:MAG: hypothetical protein AB7G93_09490 [Bdellovibrionales bacterium]
MGNAPVIRQRFFDSNGDPLAGGKLYSYQAGTSTLLATYTYKVQTVAATRQTVNFKNCKLVAYEL